MLQLRSSCRGPAGCLQALDHCFLRVAPLQDVVTGPGLSHDIQRRDDLVLVVVAEIGEPGDPAIAPELDAQFLVDAGLGVQVLVADQVAAAAAGLDRAAVATGIEQVVRVALVQVGRLEGPCDTGLDREVFAERLGSVQARAPVQAEVAVIVQAQPGVSMVPGRSSILSSTYSARISALLFGLREPAAGSPASYRFPRSPA